MSDNSVKTKRIAILAIFSAIVAVLQIMSPLFKISTVNLSLVLIPVVLGGIYFGKRAGAVLGGVFALVVAIYTVTGLDAGAYIMFSARPFVTIGLIFVKGCLAGYLAAILYSICFKISKKRVLSVVIAAVTAPVVNTGVFCSAMLLFYKDLLIQWAAGKDILFFLLTGLIGVNFLVELTLNVIICPLLDSRLKKVL